MGTLQSTASVMPVRRTAGNVVSLVLVDAILMNVGLDISWCLGLATALSAFQVVLVATPVTRTYVRVASLVNT